MSLTRALTLSRAKKLKDRLSALRRTSKAARASRGRSPLRAPSSVAVAVILGLVGSLALGVAAASADELGSGVLNLAKTAGVSTAQPGTTFVYTLNFGCSSTTTGCVDATITDPIPAPLTIAGTPSVVGAGTYSATVTGNTLSVVFKDSVPNTTPASTGLAAGTTGTVQLQVQVPAGLAKSYDGTSAVNTATFTASNAATVTASAPVALVVPTVIGSTLTKTWTPASTQFLPGAASTVTLGAANTSNIAATSLSIDEPADPATSNPFDFYDLTGFGAVVFPAGADQVQVAATTASGTSTGAVGAVPTLPVGVDPGDVTALSFVFTSSTGSTIAAGGAAGSVKVDLAQRATSRSTGASLVNGGTRVDEIGGTIATPEGSRPAVHASAQQVVAPLTVTVAAAKSFAVQELPAGQSTTATLTATNTSTGPLDSLTVREPGTGTFFTPDVSFGGFVGAASAWPAGATAATVSWFVNTGTAPADSTATAASGLPATPTLQSGQYLTGFQIVYTGVIATAAAAAIAFTVDTTTDAGPTSAGFVTYPNAVQVTGVNAAGTKSTTANADLQVYFPAIKLTLTKQIAPSTVIPGGASLVQISAQTPSGTSSVRPDTIVITEPQDPQASAYWNAFDALAIAPTSVPKGSTLLIEYTTDGTNWQTLHSVDATSAAATYSASLSQVLPTGTAPSDVRGLRFTFADDGGFGQATNVKPAIVFVARAALRDGSGPTNPGTYPTTTAYQNCAGSVASGEVHTGGSRITSDPAQACATANIQATDGGPGPLAASKAWDGIKTVQSQSGVTTGATLGWGTQITGLASMTVQDPAQPSPVSGSVFQAFDLARIDPITPTNTAGATFDPLIRWDAVSRVELFDGTSWVDITSEACPTSAACDGTFPGYTLTAAERASTQGVRLTFVESPKRAAAIAATNDPTAPPVGSGVASAAAGAFPGANANARTIHLDLKLRFSVRGATGWVTGARVYNMPGSAGAVDNTVRVIGQPVSGAPFSRDADDHVMVVDPALTVKATKTASPSSLVIPQPDVPASSYPTTTYTTTVANTSPTNTWQLRLADPVNCTNTSSTLPCVFGAYDPATNPFERLDVTGIGVTVPAASGIQASRTVVSLLHRASDGTLTTTTATIAEAQAMQPADLADVVGVSALFLGTNADGADGTGGTIVSGATATVTLATILRATSRSAGVAPVPGVVPNTVFVSLHDQVLPTTDASDQTSASVTLANGNLSVSTTKTINPTSTVQPNPTSPIVVSLSGRSTGTLLPRQLVIEDSAPTFWNAFTLTGFTVPNAPSGANQVLVEAQTGRGTSAVWNGSGGAPTSIATAALPAGVNASDVTGLRFTFSRSDGASFAASNVQTLVRLQVSLRTTLRDGGPVTSTEVTTPMPGETQPGVVTDTVVTTGRYNAISSVATANATFTVRPGTAAIAVEKTTPGQAASGKEVPWTLRFKNNGTGYLTNPVVTDTLPADGSLLFVPTNVPTFSTSTGGTLPTDPASITRTYDPVARTIVFRWPAGSRLAIGETYQITLNLQIKPGLAPATTATNTFGVTDDRTLTACTALNPGNGRPVTFAANTCSTTNIVTTLSQGSFTASKGSRSSSGLAQNIANPALACTPDTDGFFRYPCAATSTIGGTDTWKLDMVNGGNIAARALTAIDVFPYKGDVGVVDPSPRGSAFTPRFNGDLSFTPTGPAAGSTLAWFVTTAATPCTKEINPGAGSCPPGSWVPSSAIGTTIAAADVTAVKMVFDFTGTAAGNLPPAASLSVTYTTTNIPTLTAGDGRAPVTAPVTAARAWNSFGFYPTYVSGSAAAGPQEPIKSGIALTGGPLAITKTITGPAAGYAPTSFDADIACTVDGATVDLGADSTVTLDAANHYAVRVDGIPVGSVCGVTEAGAPGSWGESSRTVTPESVTIATAASASDPVPSGQSVAIVNDYGVTSLTVTKHVDTLATVGAFGPFSFTLGCVAAGGQTVPLATEDATFSLADGGSRTVSDLPIGATCTVTETDSDGAGVAPNSVAVAFGGVRTLGNTADVVLGSDATDNQAVVTNHYAAGQLSVTKTVDGDAATDFGSGPFTIHVTCVYKGDQTLFDGDLTVVGGQTALVPATFPVGTECATAETATGGATDSTVDNPSVVITGPDSGETVGLVAVDVTNTFSAGSIVLTKERTGDGVARYGSGPFTAQVVCTWMKDGQQLTIPLAGGGLVTLDEANGYTATVSGLIQGAHCDTTETATGGATAVVITPADGVTVPAGDPAQVTIANTFDTGSLVVIKKRTGAGAAAFGAGPFTVSVECTYDADGTVVPIDLGDQASLVLDASNDYTATVSGLILGADCLVRETDRGLATASATDPADGRVTITDAATPAIVTITNTFDVGHLSIAKTADRTSVSPGGTIVYTIKVVNDGRIDAKDVAVTDELPSALRLVGTSPTATVSGHTVTWTIASLPVGATAVFTVTTVLVEPSDVTNRATASTPPGPWDPTTAATPCTDDPTFSCVTVLDPPAGLAHTGSDIAGNALLAFLALLAGLALVIASKLRRKPRSR